LLLYIHIPFCDSKCFYCAFNSYTDKSHLKHNYMKALTHQLETELENYVKKHNNIIETVFIGGGTPSAVKYTEYEQVFKLIQPYINDDTEITTEANPNSGTVEWLTGMYNYGVKRVSFGVQSFNDEKLKVLGRAHKSNRAIKAIHDAKEVGFKAINCDIIYGVKGDTFESMKKDFDLIETLPITHISAYSLILEKGTKFFNQHHLKIDDEELSQDLFSYLKNMGFNQYEISNFSTKEKYESKHNKGYWQHKEYLGIGAGAVGYKNKVRYYTHEDLDEYISNPLFANTENLNDNDIKMEKVLLGFRTSLGIQMDIFTQKERVKIQDLTSADKLSVKNGRLYNENFLIADELALYILE